MSEPARYEFLDEVTSDLSFRARGASLAEAFSAAAEALLAATVERPEQVRPLVERRVELREPDLELLLLAFLDELVWLRDARGWLMRARELWLEETPEGAHLVATLEGEALDPERHGAAAEVKAATVHGLRVRPVDGGFEVRATLDV